VIQPLHAVLPASIDDPAAPSGGNRYDREVLRHFKNDDPDVVRLRPAAERGARHDSPAGSAKSRIGTVFDVHEHLMSGDWPHPAAPDRQALAALLSGLPDGALVLLDGLIACGVPDVLEPHSTRLRLVVLVHLPLGDETGLTESDAAELRALESRTLHLAAAVIATSTPAARRVEQLHGLSGVHAIPPGVGRAPLATPSPDGGRLLNVASLTPRKGQDLLLAALARLPGLSWTCTVAGAGRLPPVTPPWSHRNSPAATPPATVTLNTTAVPLGSVPAREPLVGPSSGAPGTAGGPAGVNGDGPPEPDGARVVRFAGALGGTALDEAYANADLFVLPSRAETYGMVVTEALARGLPVVAADVGGVPEALGAAPGGGIPGRLIPPGDADALAAALRDWLTDGELRERWRADARTRRESLTGWDETARRLARVLAGL
jgi:glycosyltransferase involved in cell wall biosynthesis